MKGTDVNGLFSCGVFVALVQIGTASDTGTIYGRVQGVRQAWGVGECWGRDGGYAFVTKDISNCLATAPFCRASRHFVTEQIADSE